MSYGIDHQVGIKASPEMGLSTSLNCDASHGESSLGVGHAVGRELRHPQEFMLRPRSADS
jgi:hypothetical protein